MIAILCTILLVSYPGGGFLARALGKRLPLRLRTSRQTNNEKTLLQQQQQ